MFPFMKINLVIILSLIFSTCPSYGQVQKTKQLLPEDYVLWSTINELGISDNGDWCSYQLSYSTGNDTLFAKSTARNKMYAFANGTDGSFSGNRWFGCLANDKVTLLNLETGKIESFRSADRYAFAENGQYLIMHIEKPGQQSLIIRNLISGQESQIMDADKFAVSPNSKLVAVVVKGKEGNEVLNIRLDSQVMISTVIKSAYESYQTLVWQDNSASFAFSSMTTGSSQAVSISLYKTIGNKLFTFDTRTERQWEQSRVLSCNTTSSIAISDDGERVFFTSMKKVTDMPSGNSVEIWNAADKDLWHYRMRGWNHSGQEFVWWPEKGTISMIGTDGQITGKVSGDQKYFLTYDPAPYKPSFKFTPDLDIYITELQSGKISLFLEKQFGEFEDMEMSPDGRYICYYKEGNWWAYDILQKRHHTLTDHIVPEFAGPYLQMPGVALPYGLAAWTSDKKSVLLYDAFDIWEIALEGNRARRLTRGREEKKVYRISAATFENHSENSVKFNRIASVDFRKGIILEGNKSDGSSNGFYSLSGNGSIRSLIFGKEQLTKPIKSKNGELVFVREDYNCPPEIVKVSIASEISKTVYRSNPQHDHYGWGRSELVTFRNEKGEERSAVLFYPFDYDPLKKYPMVVKVYEDLMNTLHRYINPSLNNDDGYNTTNLTSNGYFVLHPNIVYVHGARGISAANCIVDAAEAVIRYASIDRSRIGIIGHSFGGYETFFTITQTRLFAAAVAGAGISDISTSYLSMGWNFSRPETWRFEYEQGGMGIPLYESPGSYRDNSGITYADRVQTPLLSWTGANDPEVDPSQSMEFYMAMRRLQKDHIMIRYPNEGHSLLKPENEIDLTVKIMQWFDHYLKGREKPAWCEVQ